MMKRIKKEVQMVDGEGLMALLGERVLLMCMNYFYEGVLEGVNSEDVLISDPGIVYETGPWTEEKWTDRQSLGHPEHYIRKSAIESYCASPSRIIT